MRRLVLQAELLKPITERLLREAGIKPGMRILDLGSGAGDVAMLAATLVGARSCSSLGLIEVRTQSRRPENVRPSAATIIFAFMKVISRISSIPCHSTSRLEDTY